MAVWEWLAENKVEGDEGERVREGACVGSSRDVAGGGDLVGTGLVEVAVCARVIWERVLVCAGGGLVVAAVIALACLCGDGGGVGVGVRGAVVLRARLMVSCVRVGGAVVLRVHSGAFWAHARQFP